MDRDEGLLISLLIGTAYSSLMLAEMSSHILSAAGIMLY
jgi:hypothetical protein